MKRVLSGIGAIGIVVGLLWVLQGLRLVPWVLPTLTHYGRLTVGNGALLTAFAVALIVWANRTPRAKR
jgi:hypothetical protein